ncbi:hypothetical protein BHE90_017575 [Fusarium euwallaceae]|uniref:Uncharacterized protein n=1 Tax=Fusarium euwallaceae TaxID=1147111 RepID=A0A430KX42_9HYPO|nr:hypothetical protein BHE90_017575 [Fusarium euwallaceae]
MRGPTPHSRKPKLNLCLAKDSALLQTGTQNPDRSTPLRTQRHIDLHPQKREQPSLCPTPSGLVDSVSSTKKKRQNTVSTAVAVLSSRQ